MRELHRSPLIETPKRVFEGRVVGRMHDVVGWVENHPADFRRLLSTFNAVIKNFNQTVNASSEYRATNYVKAILGNRTLPTITELLSESEETSVNPYKQVLETLTDNMESEAFTFHKKDTDIHNLVVASIFVTYEAVVKARPEFAHSDFGQDYITEALTETAAGDDRSRSNTPAYELFSALASSSGMNWVEGEDRFAPEFRSRHGFN